MTKPLVVLAPLAVTNTRADPDPRAHLVDAASTSYAHVVADVLGAVTLELARFSLRKFVWVRAHS